MQNGDDMFQYDLFILDMFGGILVVQLDEIQCQLVNNTYVGSGHDDVHQQDYKFLVGLFVDLGF